MKIKKGWVYKYNEWCDDKPFMIDEVNCCKSICPYFWKSMWNILIPFVVWSLWQLFFGVIGLGAAEKLGLFAIETLSDFSWYSVLGIFFVSALSTTIGIILFFVGVLTVYATIAVLKERFSNKESNKPDNVLIAWIKAKKAKICPMIEWED